MYKIAVLASTNGTDLQAIIDEMQAGKMPGIELAGVFANKECYALERASNQGYFSYKFSTEQDLITKLKPLRPDLIVLVGYMRILSAEFIENFPAIINVHPSLIPKHCGKEFYGANVHEAVLKNAEHESGMTIHYVDNGVDTGKIILQKRCPVLPKDNVESLKQRVQALEKKWYPEVIRQLAQD